MAISSDIRKLRQQSVFTPTEDISSGDMSMGPVSQQRSTGPTFQGNPRPVSSASGVVPEAAPRQETAPTPQSLQDFVASVQGAYTPDFTSRDKLRALMDSVPERQAPSFARALVAAGLSTKADDPVKTAESVMQAPYLRDMASWKEKAGPFVQTAQLENSQNINERTVLTGAVNAKMASDRLAEQARQADEKTRVSEIRARAYAWKQTHPDWDWDTTGPTYVLKNPTTGEIKNTGIKTGELGAEDLQLLKNRGAVQAAAARGQAAVQVAQAGAAANNRDVVVIDGVQYRRNTEDAGPDYIPTTGAPSGTPTRIGTPARGGASVNTAEQIRARNFKLSEMYRDDPTFKRFIKKSGDTYTPKPRPVVGNKDDAWPGGFGGTVNTQEDVEAYDAFRREIEPGYTPPKSSPIAPGKTTPATKETSTGLGPTPPVVTKATTPPPAAPFEPRQEYQQGAKPPQGRTTPWIVEQAQKGAEQVKKGAVPPPAGSTAPNVYDKQRMTPSGNERVNPLPKPKTVVKQEYSESRNQTRITYSDGTTEMVAGKR